MIADIYTVSNYLDAIFNLAEMLQVHRYSWDLEEHRSTATIREHGKFAEYIYYISLKP